MRKNKKLITYISINFKDNKIFLKDIVSEKEGIKLCICLMKEILEVQVNSNEEQDIKIMSEVMFQK